MKKTAMYVTLLGIAALLLTLAPVGASEGAAEGSWTGEIVDVACYAAKGASGAGHADCAKACVKSGQPMGLLTADGALVILAASHESGEAFEAAKELAGQQATLGGHLDERGGVKVLTVLSAAPAS